jgi:hypothetical protein
MDLIGEVLEDKIFIILLMILGCFLSENLSW